MANTLTSGRRAKVFAGLAVVAFTALLAAAMLSISGCAPKVVNEPTQEEDPLLAKAVDWSMEGDCAVCHAIEDATMQDANCPQASLHVDMECIECHTNVEGMTSSHEGLVYADAMTTGEIKPKANTADPLACQDPECHGTMEEMAEKTVDSTALVDEKGTVVNPHDYDTQYEQHAQNQPECTDCHGIHSDELEKDAMMWCAQCHHKGVFTCGNCHELRQRAVE